MLRFRWLAVAGLCALVSCKPPFADRIGPFDGSFPDSGSDAGLGGSGGGAAGTGGGSAGGAGGIPGTGGGGMGGGAGGTGGVIATGGSGGTTPMTGGAGGGAPDANMDTVVVDTREVGMPDADPPDVATARKAIIVVGDPNALSMGDMRIRTLVQGRGFEVTMVDDGAAATAANGMALVVLTSSSMAATLGAKYRTVPVPILDMESAIFDDMRLTAATSGTDFDEEPGTQVSIIPAMQAHPLAAGKMGAVTVVMGGGGGCCGINWGKPNANAVAIATLGGTVNNAKIAIFAYETGAKLVDNADAPARRVGMFASDSALANLSADGTALVNAAIAWLVP
jgi:hypothetical protein